MRPADPRLRSIAELAPLLQSRRVSAAALTEACLGEIGRSNARLNAFITVLADDAVAAARRADEEIAKGWWRGPLHGIPVSLKDLVDVAGVPTTAASRVRAADVARTDALVVTRLRAAGAVIVGKCNLHEFAYGTTSEDSAFGPVRSPIDPGRTAGGSSGGSAVAVATGMSIASIGTDTGGSIRIPSSCCGLVGLKPTYGEVPADGIVPLARSLDHVGPIVRSVLDAWLVHHALCGDFAATPPDRDPRRPLASARLGLLRRYFCERLDVEVRRAFEAEIDRLRLGGATVVELEVPHAAEIAAVYLHVQLPESSAYHAESLEHRAADYTPSVRLRLEMGRYVLAEDYVRAQRGREVLRREVDEALSRCDALVLPTLPIAPPLVGATTVTVDGRSEPVRAMMLRETQLFNLTGHPAITIPYASTDGGLPNGLQLVGRRGATDSLLELALACER